MIDRLDGMTSERDGSKSASHLCVGVDAAKSCWTSLSAVAAHPLLWRHGRLDDLEEQGGCSPLLQVVDHGEFAVDASLLDLLVARPGHCHLDKFLPVQEPLGDDYCCQQRSHDPEKFHLLPLSPGSGTHCTSCRLESCRCSRVFRSELQAAQ